MLLFVVCRREALYFSLDSFIDVGVADQLDVVVPLPVVQILSWLIRQRFHFFLNIIEVFLPF